MRRVLRLPGVRHLHERQLLFPALVLAVVAGVLIHGALERSRAARAEPGTEVSDTGETLPAGPPEPAPPPVRPLAGVRPSLRGDLENTPLTYFSDYWAQLGSAMGPHLVALATPGHSGLVIGPRLALISVAAADALAAIEARQRLAEEATATMDAATRPGDGEGSGRGRGDGEGRGDGDLEGSGATDREEYGEDDARAETSSGVRAIDRSAGLALLELEAARLPFETGDPLALPSGSYIGLVALDGVGAPSITPGYLVSAAADGALDISLPPPGADPAAVIDLDGMLVGVTWHGPDGARTLSIGELRRLMGRMTGPEPCRAISVVPLDPAVLDLLETPGLLIDHVVSEAFRPEPSLRPGDVLVEWNGEPVASVDAFRASYDALEPGTLVRYRVIRGQRGVTGGTVLPDEECRPEAPSVVRLPRLGLAAEWLGADAEGAPDGGGWMVTTIVPDGPAGHAGILEGDRLRTIDGRAVADGPDARAAIERLDASGGPLLLGVDRGGRARLVALTPPEP